LNPIVGGNSLLHLDARLWNVAIGYPEKHPIILPKHCISELLIDHTHRVTFHGDVQLTLRTLRQEYWIMDCRDLVKEHNLCVICACRSAKTSIQLMGDLSEPRVNSSPPFFHTGVVLILQDRSASYIIRGPWAEDLESLYGVIRMLHYKSNPFKVYRRLRYRFPSGILSIHKSTRFTVSHV